jgi:ABC-2 type transport system ATP-binding protein
MTEQKQEMLTVKNLSKSYSGTAAVTDLSFTVKKGEIFGLLGPNGAGKTTSLECILGARKADEGEITLLGESGPDYSPGLFEKIGVQFQDPCFHDLIKVSELCEMTASLYAEAIFGWKTLLRQFSLEEKLNSRVSGLSGGEKQKLSVVLALIHSPELVFLDELTSGLDPAARRDVWAYLKTLQAEGLTIILTSHFMDEVFNLCSRILIIREGKRVITGTPEEVIEKSGTASMEEAYLYHTGRKGELDENFACIV